MEAEKKRRRFDAGFKSEAVAMITEGGMTQAQVARQLGIESKRLSAWKKQLAEHKTVAKAFPGNGNDRDAEMVRLRRELALAQMERDILKKAAIIFAGVPRR